MATGTLATYSLLLWLRGRPLILSLTSPFIQSRLLQLQKRQKGSDRGTGVCGSIPVVCREAGRQGTLLPPRAQGRAKGAGTLNTGWQSKAPRLIILWVTWTLLSLGR